MVDGDEAGGGDGPSVVLEGSVGTGRVDVDNAGGCCDGDDDDGNDVVDAVVVGAVVVDAVVVRAVVVGAVMMLDVADACVRGAGVVERIVPPTAPAGSCPPSSVIGVACWRLWASVNVGVGLVAFVL